MCAKFRFSISSRCDDIVAEVKGGNFMPPPSGWRVARRPSGCRVKLKSYLKLNKKYVFSEGEQFPLTTLSCSFCKWVFGSCHFTNLSWENLLYTLAVSYQKQYTSNVMQSCFYFVHVTPTVCKKEKKWKPFFPFICKNLAFFLYFHFVCIRWRHRIANWLMMVNVDRKFYFPIKWWYNYIVTFYNSCRSCIIFVYLKHISSLIFHITCFVYSYICSSYS